MFPGTAVCWFQASESCGMSSPLTLAFRNPEILSEDIGVHGPRLPSHVYKGVSPNPPHFISSEDLKSIISTLISFRTHLD